MDIDYKKYYRDKQYLENEALFRNIFSKRYFLIKTFVRGVGRVLDIGCTNGIFLDLFSAQGWETWGVEPSENGQIAKDKGHKVIKSYFESSKVPNDYFDLVILNHTLEHMDDPLVVLKKVNNILKKKGILFIDVPNYGGLGSKVLGKRWPFLLPDEHKHQFTKEGLKSILYQSRFKPVYFKSRSGIFEFANPILELWQSLIGLKKRFFWNLILLPYSALATITNSGDSMSIVGRKL